MIKFAIGESLIELDLRDAERAFVSIETKCGVRGCKPTEALLDELAKWLFSVAGSVVCTRTAAWQVWWAVYERIEQLRRDAELNADLSYWYHVDAFSLTAEQRLGLLFNLPRVKAQGRLAAGNFDSTDYRAIYNLTLLATGDEAQAERAKADALERFVDAKMGTS